MKWCFFLSFTPPGVLVPFVSVYLLCFLWVRATNLLLWCASEQIAAKCNTVRAIFDKLFPWMDLSGNECSAGESPLDWGCEIKRRMNAPDYVIIFKRQSRQRLWKINQRPIQKLGCATRANNFLGLWTACERKGIMFIRCEKQVRVIMKNLRGINPVCADLLV